MTETMTPLTLTVDRDRARLTFGPFVLEVIPDEPGGGDYYLAAHRATDLAAHTPDDDWPVPLGEFTLTAEAPDDGD